MRMDDYDGQMMFGDLVGLKLPDIRLTGEEKPRKNLIQEACPNRGSNLDPLRDKHACYHLFHNGWHSSQSTIGNMAGEFYDKGIRKMPQLIQKCIDRNGDYDKK